MQGRFALGISLAVFAAAPATAQPRLAVSLVLPPPVARVSVGPTITITNAFADSRGTELLNNAFPGRVRVTVELWESRGWFDDLIASTGWQREVLFDPYSKTFRVARVQGDTRIDEGRYTTLDEVRRALSVPQRAQIQAPRGRRGLYYTTTVTVEALNSNDLEEAQRWLRGGSKTDPGSALVRGIRTLFSRVLGGDMKRVEAHSTTFDTAESRSENRES